MTLNLQSFRNSILRIRTSQVFGFRYGSQKPGSEIKQIDITSIDEIPKYEIVRSEEDKERILQMRNKSGLNPNHLNEMHGITPYKQSFTWFHDTIRFKGRMLGRFGIKGLEGVPVSALWPLQDDIEDKMCYEKTKNPYSIQEGWKIVSDRNLERDKEIREREESILQALSKSEQWKQEYLVRIEKKEAATKAAVEKKKRIIEEIREQFGFKIDVKDARFQEALAAKQKEDKKKKKEKRKQDRAAKYMSSLVTQANVHRSEKIESESTKEQE